MSDRRPGRGAATLAVLALVATCLAVAPAPVMARTAAIVGAAAPVRVTTTTPVPCALWNQQLPTDWYLPTTAPIGLLYAQHGFAESKDDWVDFGMSAAAAGFVVVAPTLPSANLFGCTVQSLNNNTRFLGNVANLFAGAGDANGALARSFAAALVLAGRPELTLPSKLAIVGHSVGGESALYVAGQLSGSGRSGADLRGVVLADPVRSLSGGNLATALRELSGSVVPGSAVVPAATEPAGSDPAPTSQPGADPAAGTTTAEAQPVPLPILVLAAPPQSCNAGQSATRDVIGGLPDRTFFGAAITTGSHGDIFGTSVNKFERLTCGQPRQVNIDAVRALAIGWLTDAVTGSQTADWYPGGTSYDTLISRGVVSTLR
ncbi:MAG: hypothetical protein ABWZ98_02940 [Nakamurella sp.]